MQKFIARERYDFGRGVIGWRPGGPFDCLGPYAKVQNCPVVIPWLPNAPPEIRRTVYATGYPDTYFSIPAVCKIKGMRVRGYICLDDGHPEFHLYSSERSKLCAWF